MRTIRGYLQRRRKHENDSGGREPARINMVFIYAGTSIKLLACLRGRPRKMKKTKNEQKELNDRGWGKP